MNSNTLIKNKIYRIIIPARANSKRLPGKNMKILVDKPLIQYSIDFALNNFSADSIWVNSDDKKIIEFSEKKGIRTLFRPDDLATDLTPTVDVLKFHVNYFKENNIDCDAIILLQPTNPLRQPDLIKNAIDKFEKSNCASLATFSLSNKKIGRIENNSFKPMNYSYGQRSQDLKNTYFENGLLYITKVENLLKDQVITECVYPLICHEIESYVDIDFLEDFIFAESLLKLKK